MQAWAMGVSQKRVCQMTALKQKTVQRVHYLLDVCSISGCHNPSRKPKNALLLYLHIKRLPPYLLHTDSSKFA